MIELEKIQSVAQSGETVLNTIFAYQAHLVAPFIRTNVDPGEVRKTVFNFKSIIEDAIREAQRNAINLNPSSYKVYLSFANSTLTALLDRFSEEIRSKYAENPGKFAYLALAKFLKPVDSEVSRSPDAVALFVYSNLKTLEEYLNKRSNNDAVSSGDESTTLKGIFNDQDHYEPCVNILREINPPAINDDGAYIGVGKGVFPLWINLLLEHSFIKKQKNNATYSRMLNDAFSGLNLTKLGSEFTKEYKKLNTSDIPDDIKFKLSQIKQ